MLLLAEAGERLKERWKEGRGKKRARREWEFGKMLGLKGLQNNSEPKLSVHFVFVNSLPQ